MGRGQETREQIFEFIVHYKRDHGGLSPSVREIAEACYVSEAAVKYHRIVLERDGRILVQGRRLIEIPGETWDLPDDEHGGQNNQG